MNTVEDILEVCGVAIMMLSILALGPAALLLAMFDDPSASFAAGCVLPSMLIGALMLSISPN